MNSLTFLINDSSTGGQTPVIQVQIVEAGDGTLKFTLTQLAGYVGDLRGLFFDVADESLIGSLTASATNLTDFQQGNDSVKDLGNGANMQGLLGDAGGYDVGVEIGSSGLKTNDDIRTFSFTLDSSLRDLTIADFSNVSFGARVTSVGLDSNLDGVFETSRSGSSKTGEVTFRVITPTADAAPVVEDATASGNVLANDGAGAGDALSVTSWDGGVLGTAVAFADLHGTTVQLNADGSYTVDASAADTLQAGQVASRTFTYDVLQTNVDGVSTHTVSFTVSITGTNDVPVIAAAVQAAAATEIADNAIGENAITHTGGGTIAFGDIDSLDTHSVSFAPAAGGYRGAFSATLADDSTGDGQGAVAWSFSVADGDLDDLQAGQVLTQSYGVTIDDGHGGSATQTVTIKITGTNDAPTITSGAQAGAATEVADNAIEENATTHGAGGAVTFADVDTLDTHSATFAPQASGYRGTFALASVDQGGNSIGWTFSVADGDLDDLQAGQVLTQSYGVTVDDGHGGTAMQTVTITLTGTNDAPTITSGAQAGAATEVADNATGENATTHGAGGAVTFADVDTLDTHSATFAPQASGYRGTFALASVDQGGNSIGWTFSVADGDLDDLQAGQTLTQKYNVTVDDGHGGNPTQTVTVVLMGTNDAPVITSGAQNASVTEVADLATGENTAAHVRSGTVLLADADVLDAHTASFTPLGSGYLGTFSLGSVNQGSDSIGWSFSVADSALDSLQAGQTRTQSYDVAVDDGHGGSATQTVQVTLTGTNDAPVINAGQTFTFEYPNSSNNYSSSPAAYTESGFLFQGFYDYPYAYGAGGSGMTYTHSGWNWVAAGNDGLIRRTDGQNFSLESFSASTYQYGGQSDYIVTITGLDNGAAVASRTINYGLTHQTFTFDATWDSVDELRFNLPSGQVVNGTYYGGQYLFLDNLVVGFGTAAATIGEIADGAAGEGTATHSRAGTVTFSDVDTLDTHTASFTPQASGYRGTFALASVDQGGNSVGWTFSVADGALDDLQAGQTLTQKYNLAVDDGHGGSATQTVTVTITGTNDGPIAVADTNAGDPVRESGVNPGNTPFGGDASAVGNVLANDTDVDGGDTKTVSAVNGLAGNVGGTIAGTYGSLVISPNGSYTYMLDNADPDTDALAQGASASEVFTYTVSDGAGASSSATLTIGITGTNDAPVALNDTNALTAATLDGVSNSTFVNWVDWTSASNGVVQGTIDLGNGQTIGVTYTGEYAFTQTSGGEDYYITGSGSSPYTSALVDNRPTGTDIIALSQATQKTLTFSQPVEDLFFAIVSLNGNGYLFDQDFQIASYGHGYWGNGSATRNALPDGRYEVVGSGELHGVLRVEGSIQSLTWTSQTPEYWNGFTVGTYGKAESATASGNLLANDSDPDTGGTFSVSAVNGQAIVGNSITLDLASGARVTVDRSGSYLYDEDGAFASLGVGQTFADSFQYTIRDQHGATSTATAAITVTGANEKPLAAADSFNAHEDTVLTIAAPGLLQNDSDPDSGTTLSVSLGAPTITTARGATVTLNADGSFSYDARNAPLLQALNDGQFDDDSFTYTVTDGIASSAPATVTVHVTGATDNRPPVAFGDSFGTNEDTPLSANVLANDTDPDSGDTLSVSNPGVFATAHGSVTLTGTGQFTYTPALNYHGPDSFTYSIRDAAGAVSNTATVNLTVASVNDKPFATNDGAKTAEDASVTINVLANDTDADGDALTVTGFSGLSHGTAQIVDNKIVFTPDANFHGTELFSYTVADGHGGTDTAGVVVTVTPVNDSPVAVNDAVSTGEDAALTITATSLLANDTDPDTGDTKTLVSVQGATNGTVSLSAGTVTFTPNANYNGPASFTYTMKDSAGVTSTATVDVTVNAVNDAPVIGYAPQELIVNGSFEQMGSGGTSGGSTAITGWTVTGSDIDRVSSSGWQPGDGAYSLDMNGFYPGGVQQVLQTTPGTQYTVNFELSKNPGNTDHGTLQVSAGATTATYTYSDANSELDMNWRSESFTFVATSTTTTLKFESTYPTGGFAYPFRAQGPALDSVSMMSSTTANEDGAISIRGLGVGDLDAGGDPMQLTLSVGHGGLALASTTGLSGDLNGADGVLSFNGSQAAINAALAGGITYTPSANYNGGDTLAATIDDQGHNGAGGALSASRNVALTVNSVNDAPNANLFASTSNANVGDVITFDASASSDLDGDALSYAWDLDGDGAYDDATGATTGTAFSTAGIHTVSVRATDPGGLSAAASVNVNVINPTPINISQGQTFSGSNGYGAYYANGGNNGFSGMGGGSAGAYWNSGSLNGAAGNDTLTNYANAYGGSGGYASSGGTGSGGSYAGSSSSGSGGNYYNYYYYNSGTSGGYGGTGGSGGGAYAQLAGDALLGHAGTDTLTLTAFSSGGSGATGASGGSGGNGYASQYNQSSYTTYYYQYYYYYGWYYVGTGYENYYNTYYGSSGGAGGAGGGGGAGANASTYVASNYVEGSAAADTITVSAQASGGNGGYGGSGGAGGYGASAGASGSGGAGGYGGDSNATVQSNTIMGGDGDDAIRLIASALGGMAGGGGNGASANFGEATQTYYSAYYYYYYGYGYYGGGSSYTSYNYRTYGSAGAGGSGGVGGDATSVINGNNVQGGEGNDTISLEVTVDVGAGGNGGAGGSIGTSYNYWSGSYYYQANLGSGGASGPAGANGGYYASIQGNTLDGGGGNDTFKFLVNVVDGSGSVYVQGNNVFGGAGVDTLDLSAIGRSVSVNLAANQFYAGTGSNTVTGVENVIGSSLGDSITGDANANALTGAVGADTLAGGAGSDRFVYRAASEGGDSIVDFTKGAGGDVLDIHDVLTGFAGYNGTNAFSGGYLQFAPNGTGGTLVRVDANGGGDSFVTLATITSTLLLPADTANYVI